MPLLYGRGIDNYFIIEHSRGWGSVLNEVKKNIVDFRPLGASVLKFLIRFVIEAIYIMSALGDPARNRYRESLRERRKLLPPCVVSP